MLLGIYEKDWNKKKKGNIPNRDRSMFSQERYMFFLGAPFEISNRCCDVMKKDPIKEYEKRTKKKGMTAQMAAESRLREQQWLNNGCNGFDMMHPISNPMSFWTEQDVLQYIQLFDLPIASVYEYVAVDYLKMGEIDGQMDLSDIGIGSCNKLLKTTGCKRTGCIFCGFGMHLEKPPCKRMYETIRLSNPKLTDYQLRGGAFDPVDGLWKPDNRGLGFWFVLEWCNIHGGMNYQYPNKEHYIAEYSTPETDKHLKKED